jgi:hypothetical protein
LIQPTDSDGNPNNNIITRQEQGHDRAVGEREEVENIGRLDGRGNCGARHFAAGENRTSGHIQCGFRGLEGGETEGERNESEKNVICERNESEKNECERNESEKNECERNESEKNECERNESEKKECERNESEGETVFAVQYYSSIIIGFLFSIGLGVRRNANHS